MPAPGTTPTTTPTTTPGTTDGHPLFEAVTELTFDPAPSDPAREAAEAAVEDGAAFLDDHGPHAWARRVDLRTLDLSEPHACVLAQIYRTNFSAALRSAELPGVATDPYDAAVRYGFDAPDAYDYDELTEAWAQEVRNRL